MDLSLRASSLPSVLCARASSSLLALNDYLCLGASLTETHALNFYQSFPPPTVSLSSASNYISPVLRRWRFSCSELNAVSLPTNSWETNCCLPHSTSLLTNTSLCFSSPSGLSCSDQDCKHTLKSLFYL